jgi:hypothetical protein
MRTFPTSQRLPQLAQTCQHNRLLILTVSPQANKSLYHDTYSSYKRGTLGVIV